MKVVCKIDNLSQITNERLLQRLRKYINMPDGELSLYLGREYTVYGVTFWDNSPWYYLCAEEGDEYPAPFAAEFFDVVDNRLSSHWTLFSMDSGDGVMESELVFKEWAENPLFYEHLLDGYPEAEAVFDSYRKLMDQEYEAVSKS